MTEQMPKPGAVHFRPCNSEQIRSRAEKDIRAELKGSTSIASWASFATIGWMPFVGFVAFFFGTLGIVLGVILWLVCIGLFFFGAGASLWGVVGVLDSAKVAGASHKWRNMCEGDCPICRTMLLISPPEVICKIRCPQCKVLLDYENGYVSACN